MLVVFVIRKNPLAVYVTTPDYFSWCLQELQVKQDEVIWHNVSMESLIMLKDKQCKFMVLLKGD